MPLSVTCQCGSRLEIDEKFLGKVVPCPDCQRPLPTNPPATPPPQLPDNRRVSGLAVLSLTLALIGAFTIVGTFAAIAVGVFALREIARRSGRLEGVGYARAGIILGSVFTVITLAALISPVVFGIDVFLREMATLGNIEYDSKKLEVDTNDGPGTNVEITRPSDAWGKYNTSKFQTDKQQSDTLVVLVNNAEDAYIVCQSVPLEGDEKLDDRQKKVLDAFYRSDLVNILGRLRGKSLNAEGTIVESKPASNDQQALILDLRLRGIDRRFLIQFSTKELNKSSVVIVAARKNRFDRILENLREKKTFDSVKFR